MTQEHSKWVREKTAAVTEYIGKKREIDSAVAGRGFSNPPGFLYELQTGLELAIKQKLSSVNYSILDEMIKQELKQSGLDYDLAFKNAMIAWESDKQTLLNNWNQELAMVKRGMAYDDEAIKALAIEVSKRGALLITAKTAIEREAEAIRLEMAELDGTTGDYEVTLANLKQLTAQKKLEIIPYIQQIINIEEDIIEKEYQLVAKAKELVLKSEEMVSREYEILDKDQQIAVKAELIADKIVEITAKDTEIVVKNQELLAIAQSLAEKIGEIVSKDTEIIAKTVEIASKESELIAQDKSIAEKDTDSISKDREVVNELEIVADKSEQLVDKETEIIDKNIELVAKQEIILQKTREITAKDLEIIDKNVEIVDKELSIVSIAEQIGSKNAEIVAKNQSLVTLQSVILGILEQIADKESEIVTINQTIADKQTIIKDRLVTIVDGESLLVDKEELVVQSKDAEVEAYEQLIEKDEALISTIESEVLPEKENLIAAEKEAVLLKESLVRPALESLIDVMDRYVIELAVQLTLYNEITVIKTNTVTVKEEQAVKMGLLLEKRRDVSEAMSALTILLSGLSDYKLAELAPKLSELVDVYDRYADTVVEQTEIKTAISEVKAAIYGLIPQQVQGELNILDADVSLNNARLSLTTSKLATRVQDGLNRVARITQQATDLNVYAGYWEESQNTELVERTDAFNTALDIKETQASNEFEDTVDNRLAIDEAGREADRDSADAYKDHINDKVDIQTSSDGITAQLNHLLSQD